MTHFSQLGGHGTLLLNEGAQVTVNNGMAVGTGGTVGGWNGTINGGVVLTMVAVRLICATGVRQLRRQR